MAYCGQEVSLKAGGGLRRSVSVKGRGLHRHSDVNHQDDSLYSVAHCKVNTENCCMPWHLLLNSVHAFCQRALMMFQEQSSSSTLFTRRNLRDTTTSSRTQREVGSDPGRLAPELHPTICHYSNFQLLEKQNSPQNTKNSDLLWPRA